MELLRNRLLPRAHALSRRLMLRYAAFRVRRSVWDRSFPRVGSIRFGDLRKLTPISHDFGYNRGKPIDRYYIEQFLAANAQVISGDVLEIGHNTYTHRFGGSRVRRSDVLHVEEGHPNITIVADLNDADHLPGDTYDAIIFSQTLHLIYDMRRTIHTLHRMLRPGGVLLATFPGISQIDRGEWSEQWLWGLTSHAARRLFSERFNDDIVVEGHGNVLTAIGFLTRRSTATSV